MITSEICYCNRCVTVDVRSFTAVFVAVQEMEQLAISGDYPAIAAVVASNGGEACPLKPAGSGSNATVPSPAVDGPTFYR